MRGSERAVAGGIRNWVAATLVMAACVTALAGLAGVAARGSAAADAKASMKTPITILWIGDTTGPVKVYGDAQLAGVEGAVAYYNSRGGIGGHRVVLHAVSDNGDPSIAASVLTQQLSSKTPTMVWAGSVSADAAAMVPILARHHVFSISLSDGQAQCSTNAAKTCPNEWITTVPTGFAQQRVADWIKERNVKTVGLLEEETPYSASETPLFLKAAARDGLTVKTASYPATALDLTPEMQALKDGGAQVVYAEGIGTAQYVFAARANLAWNVPLIFDPSASSIDLTKLTSAANIQNAYEAVQYEIDQRTANPGLDTMVKWAGRYANVTALPLNVTSTGWDQIVALNAAVITAGGSLSVDKLDAAMLHIPPSDPLRTLSHELGWTRSNHENVLGGPNDFAVIPVGPVVGGRVQVP
jgi:ABC-type branched-subunit amino acid transport system substrate-binding protein